MTAGWVQRFAGGYTKRANSINALEVEIEFDQIVEERAGSALSRARLAAGLAPDAARPAGTAMPPWPTPATAGSTRASSSAAPSTAGSSPIPRSGSTPAPSAAWLAGFAELSPVAPAHRETMARMLRSIAAPVGFARVEDAGEPIAFALGVVDGDHVGLFDVLVAPQARRRGLARRLTESIVRLGPRAGRALRLSAGGGDQRRRPCRSTPPRLRDGLQLRLSRAIVCATGGTKNVELCRGRRAIRRA